MNDCLYMVQLRLDPVLLIQFAQDHGVNQAADEDLGYGVHAWLAALFGPLAPKPFRLLEPGTAWRKDQPLQWLGYSRQDGATLREQAETFALPLALAVCDVAELTAAKPMPATWPVGRRLGFEVLACPVSRRETEKDVFLRRVESMGETHPPVNRVTVYGEWLARQVKGAATLESVQLAGFRLVRLLRRSQRTATQEWRFGRPVMLPQALLRGVMTVRDEAAFAALLARGVGRHRAFGYGMLLLRPSA
ncbi:MAG TPA: type I-E CRISPR-associated protein Cas6/Cse3/CasE [Candidatus Competibacteraceae bacterium]|nr:type I-E CRISPR-associated protein Cas6/Cse3/CasE [Candidatus Competibacteraceae bacterium]MCP5134087.1 type I-E CRISPR-associated protein Cas6/Cse3/CasE [Gammaproteobacteria bacterium]HRY19745.1 type I-E CRISPR-associated protein Cas6/Cse3/CasE [Candidatus Competibacteraceae bacterium]